MNDEHALLCDAHADQSLITLSNLFDCARLIQIGDRRRRDALASDPVIV
jgi:hypothetical protein